MKIFAEIVEEVQELDLHEKEELSSLLQKMIIDSRREEIFQNGQEARSLEGTYNFTSNISELKKRLSAT
jgi:hypothetical protein